MKKAHVWFGLCLLLALAAVGSAPVAQPAPSNDVMAGKGLSEAGETAQRALSSGDYKSLYGVLDEAARGQVALLREKLMHFVDTSGLTDDQVKNYCDGYDPHGEFAITSVTDLKALTDAQFLGLTSGMLTLQAARPSENLALTWHLVQKSVGLMQARRSRMRHLDMLPWSGAMAYANRADEAIDLVFSLEDGKWKLSYFLMESGREEVDFTNFVEQARNFNKDRFRWNPRDRYRMDEGEQMLGSARDYCRVEYSKTGSEADTVKAFDKADKEDWFTGAYYKATKLHVGFKGDWNAAIEVQPTAGTKAYGLMKFQWASGNSEIEWFETQAELEAGLEKLKNELPTDDGGDSSPSPK